MKKDPEAVDRDQEESTNVEEHTMDGEKQGEQIPAIYLLVVLGISVNQYHVLKVKSKLKGRTMVSHIDVEESVTRFNLHKCNFDHCICKRKKYYFCKL